MTFQASRYEALPKGIDLVGGLWLMLSPLVLRFPTAIAALNSVVFGTLIAAIATQALVNRSQSLWSSWIITFMGVWLIASPWYLGFAVDRGTSWGTVLGGAVVTMAGFWSALTGAIFPDGTSGEARRVT